MKNDLHVCLIKREKPIVIPPSGPPEHSPATTNGPVLSPLPSRPTPRRPTHSPNLSVYSDNNVSHSFPQHQQQRPARPPPAAATNNMQKYNYQGQNLPQAYGFLITYPKSIVIIQTSDSGGYSAATVVCALLTYSGLIHEPEVAVQVFAVKRNQSFAICIIWMIF